MKILFLQKMNGVSGSELYLMQALPELKKRGYDVQMLIIFPVQGDKNGKFIEYLAQYGIITHEIYGHGALSLPLLVKINRILKRNSFDLVQTNLIHADFWMAWVKILFNRKLKIVSVTHGYNPAYQAKYGYDLRHLKKDPYYWIQKFACRMINFNVTISKALYNAYVEGKIIKRSKIKNIYYGLTLTDPLYKENVSIPDEAYAVIVGRVIPFKGHIFLIKAWELVAAKYPTFKLYIVGDGTSREELEKKVKEMGLTKQVVFWGHQPDPHPFMQQSLFTLVTSKWEGFGLILLESWLHKKPVVAFDAPAMNEVIDDNKNGLLAKALDSDDLAQKIIYLYEHPELLKPYGQHGYEKLTGFYTLERMTDEMEIVYHALKNNVPVPLEEKLR